MKGPFTQGPKDAVWCGSWTALYEGGGPCARFSFLSLCLFICKLYVIVLPQRAVMLDDLYRTPSILAHGGLSLREALLSG